MEQEQWVLADASSAGIVRFACGSAAADRPSELRTMASGEYSTFTDALLAYQRGSGVALRGADCVLAVAGVAVGDTIPVMRSRWTISRAGLTAVLDRAPTIVNDVAATAWSLLGGARVEPLADSESADFARPGRWALLLFDDGIGSAALDVAPSGAVTVLDAEAGHAGFAPQTEDELTLLRQLRARHPHVSWEAALTGGFAPGDERWAALAGAFAGDALLALGAWSGVIVTGRHAVELRKPRHQAAFTARLRGKAAYHRQLAAAARCLLPLRDPLAGAHALLRERHRRTHR